jgi:hypothetical protein
VATACKSIQARTVRFPAAATAGWSPQLKILGWSGIFSFTYQLEKVGHDRILGIRERNL